MKGKFKHLGPQFAILFAVLLAIYDLINIQNGDINIRNLVCDVILLLTGIVLGYLGIKKKRKEGNIVLIALTYAYFIELVAKYIYSFNKAIDSSHLGMMYQGVLYFVYGIAIAILFAGCAIFILNKFSLIKTEKAKVLTDMIYSFSTIVLLLAFVMSLCHTTGPNCLTFSFEIFIVLTASLMLNSNSLLYEEEKEIKKPEVKEEKEATKKKTTTKKVTKA